MSVNEFLRYLMGWDRTRELAQQLSWVYNDRATRTAHQAPQA
ncbi:MAG TPA: hypothetical protein VEP49_13765 [Acidimicrobiia bacterium]|nr:hypothetical protein [Acidimicrobiia bacterium]